MKWNLEEGVSQKVTKSDEGMRELMYSSLLSPVQEIINLFVVCWKTYEGEKVFKHDFLSCT